MTMFELTYRDKFMSHKVFVQAQDLPQAVEVGKEWVKRQGPDHRYVMVQGVVVADASILEPGGAPLIMAPTAMVSER